MELSFHVAVYVASVAIYETHSAGALRRVRLLDPNGNWDTVWEERTTSEILNVSSRVYSPPVVPRRYTTKQMRLEVDTSGFTQDYGIDAVEITEGRLPESLVFKCVACPAGFYKDFQGNSNCLINVNLSVI